MFRHQTRSQYHLLTDGNKLLRCLCTYDTSLDYLILFHLKHHTRCAYRTDFKTFLRLLCFQLFHEN